MKGHGGLFVAIVLLLSVVGTLPPFPAPEHVAGHAPAPDDGNFPDGNTYYVATDGSDATGDGSSSDPWATINHARGAISSGDTVIVRDGTYTGPVSFGRAFDSLTTFRAQNPYRARLTMSSGRVSVYGGQNISIEGFDICGQSGHSEYLIHVSWASTQNVTFENNIIHDSYNNDLIKVNDRARNLNFTGNLMYNPNPHSGQGNELMDINTVMDVDLTDNIFLNDFEWSGRTSNHQLHPLILIKNSGSEKVSERFNVQRNIFLNWDGRPDQPFLLLGEDAKSFHEAEDVLIENNLFLGNSEVPIEAAFGIKCAKNVTFRANTIAGDMPNGGWAYAYRINLEGTSSPLNEDIFFYNNIWSDPNGTMNDFSDGPRDDTTNGVLDNNLYWNGGNNIPVDASVLNFTNDQNSLVADPLLGDQSDLALPRWDRPKGQFVSGNTAIGQEFVRLVDAYGTPGQGSPAVDNATPAHMPADDILGNLRAHQGQAPDIGALEHLDPLTYDLALGRADIDLSVPAPVAGDEVRINATVHNLGDSNATDVGVDFYDGDPSGDGRPIATSRIVDRVPAGGQASTGVLWNTTGRAGPHDIFVVVDAADNVTELDETNNNASVHLEVAAHGPLRRLTVSPPNSTITTDQVRQFEATGHDGHDNIVPVSPSWEVTGGGTMNRTGLFNATTPGTWTVFANQSGVSGQACITVTTGSLNGITVSPASVDMTTDDHQVFTATGLDSDGNPLDISPEWSVSGGGTMDRDGNFTASEPGTWTVRATVLDVEGTATVNVTVGELDHMVVEPAQASLMAGHHRLFTAGGYDADDNPVDVTPTWDVDGGGTIDARGNFSAVSVGEWTVFANHSGISGSAGVTVTVGELDNITVTPADVTLEVDRTQPFNATGQDAFGNPFPLDPKWGVSGGGTITASGLFTAGEAGNWTVYAIQDGVTGEARVEVPAEERPPVNRSDVDGDGLPDDWERTWFDDLGNGPLDDPDRDGLSNLEEYREGTDPTSKDTGSGNGGSDTGTPLLWMIVAVTAAVIAAVLVLLLLLMRRRGME